MEHEFPMVEMSDGVHLDVSVYIPDGAVELPLIVRQHGGGSNKDSEYDVKYAKTYVETGNFAVLMYSHRGHGSSEGIFDFFGERTTLDVSDILDWIESDASGIAGAINTDNVGTNGYSQGGGESLLPAMHDSRIKAVAVGQTFDDLNHALNPGDCFKFSFATGIFALAYKTSASKTDDLTALRWGAQWDTDTEDVAIPYVDALGNAGVLSTTDDAAARSPATHVDGTPGFYANGLHVPTFWSQSWEDSLFPADHGLGILANLEADGVPTHYWFASGGHETREENPPTVEAKEAAMLEWFDEFLRGVDHGFASGDRDKVDYAQRFGGGWRHKTATSWPISATTARFDVVGRLAPDDGVLVREGSGGPAHQPVVVVNDVASANVGTEPILSNRAGGPMPAQWAMIPDGANPLDTALFSSGHLTEDLETTGAPLFHLNYQTTALKALQINAKLWDVAPDGTRTLVTRGCGSPPTGSTTSMSFDLPLWPNSHIFPVGHKIQLTVSTTDFPTFKPDVEPSLNLILSGSSLTLPGVTE